MVFSIFTGLYNHHRDLILEPDFFVVFLNNKEDLLVHVERWSKNDS